jgi:hypothetical protein
VRDSSQNADVHGREHCFFVDYWMTSRYSTPNRTGSGVCVMVVSRTAASLIAMTPLWAVVRSTRSLLRPSYTNVASSSFSFPSVITLKLISCHAGSLSPDYNLVSWVGACPGEEESAGVNRSKRAPTGNRHMRRILNQCANAGVKQKGSIFEILYRRLEPRLGHNKTIGAITHRLCNLIWLIMHNGVRYEERGPAVSENSKRLRTQRMIRTLRNLGYRVEPLEISASVA